ncbi:MAG TPA: 2-dehydropantoate 2-reductase [Acidobacteriaceae bacterium]|nr:2-dehydropantoate 2-reductase [Acidobacteriaceae bacterium]
MNIAILGAGAMGSLFGGLLAEAGAPVTLLDVNQEHLDAIRRDGLSLDTDSRPRHIRSLAALRPEEATEVPDLLLIFTKTWQIPTALGSVRRLLGPHTWVLTLQNGLGNVEAISAFVPRERILVGVTTIPADFLGPAHVASHGGGQIRMGYAAGDASTDHPGHRPFNGCCMLCQVVDLFHRAGLRATADPGVWAAIWEKVAFNAAFNALCAVTGCTVEQIGFVASGPEMVLAVVAEVIGVAHAAGIPANLERTQTLVLRSFRTHAGHQPSMLQDILAGRPTEIDSINGAIVRTARAHNIPVPCTEMLWTLVSLIDARHAPPGPASSALPKSASASKDLAPVS